MKTVAEIKELIKQLDMEHGESKAPLTRHQQGRLRRFYYKVQLYLETNPREQFLHNMKADRERHIHHITSIITHKLMVEQYPKLTYPKARNQFLRDNGVPGMKDMVKTIDFILN